MRSVTVRVTEDGDWRFQAERADGSLLFSLEFVEDGQSDSAVVAAPLPGSDPDAAGSAKLPYHMGNFGTMLGSPNPEWEQQLYNLRDVVELALPQPTGSRVVEIGAGSGETTVAYARNWKGVDHWLIDPQLICAGGQPAGDVASSLLIANHGKYFPAAKVIRDDASIFGQNLDKQDLSLLVCTAELNRQEQASLLAVWLPHLVETGRVILRLPDEGIALKLKGMDVQQAGEWLLYTPEEKHGD
jgi:hypothetical protein